MAGRHLRMIRQKIRHGASGDWPRVVALLSASGLPTSDLSPEHVARFLIAEASGETTSGEIAGCVAVEPHEEYGLLRSLAVAPEARGTGLGGALLDAALAHARGLNRLVLLTETAEAFFRARGWAPVARETLPLAVRQSSEFRGSCCASAVCLWREVPEAEVSTPEAGVRAPEA